MLELCDGAIGLHVASIEGVLGMNEIVCSHSHSPQCIEEKFGPLSLAIISPQHLFLVVKNALAEITVCE